MANVPRGLVVVAGLALFAGCQEDAVTHSRIVKPTEPATEAPPAPAAPVSPMAPAAPMAGGAMGSMGAGAVPPPPKPMGAAKLDWSLPSGWTQTLTGGIRFATLKPPGPGNVDASVVVLAGPAGGEVANVNRWRSQIGLPPLEEAALPSVRKSVTSKAGPVTVYDFTSEGVQKTRLVAGLLVTDDNTWFFKMTGEAGAVGKALPEFTHLLQSLRAPSGAN
jgi:hypothetical protein